MKAFVATLLLAVLSAASAAPSLYAPGAALAGPITGPNSLAGPVAGPTRISGAVDLGAVVTGAVAGPSAVQGSVSAGTAIIGGHGPLGILGVPGLAPAWGHGAVLAGPVALGAHLAGPIAPGALIAGPSGVINAGHGLLGHW